MTDFTSEQLQTWSTAIRTIWARAKGLLAFVRCPPLAGVIDPVPSEPSRAIEEYVTQGVKLVILFRDSAEVLKQLPSGDSGSLFCEASAGKVEAHGIVAPSAHTWMARYAMKVAEQLDVGCNQHHIDTGDLERDIRASWPFIWDALFSNLASLPHEEPGLAAEANRECQAAKVRADRQAQIVAAAAGKATVKERKKAATVAERMHTLFHKNYEQVALWTLEQFASALGCTESTVHATPTWKLLQGARDAAKSQRIEHEIERRG